LSATVAKWSAVIDEWMTSNCLVTAAAAAAALTDASQSVGSMLLWGSFDAYSDGMGATVL